MYKEIRIKPHIQKWFRFRMNGVGSSEMATVCAAYSDELLKDVYGTPVNTYLEKIAEPVEPFTGNIFTKSGQGMESFILNLYKHYDHSNPDPEYVWDNYLGKSIKHNRIINRNVFVVNEKYPWIFASPDSIGYGPAGRYNVEAKKTSGMEVNKYTNKVSPSFLVQVYTVLLITGWSHADICMLIDGTYFEVITVEPDKEWFDFIIESSHDFWYNHVLKAREIKSIYNINAYWGMDDNYYPEEWKHSYDELGGNSPVGMLQSLEPDLVGTDRELEFIKNHIKPRPEKSKMLMTDEQWTALVDYVKMFNIQKEHQYKVDKIKHKLMVSLQGYEGAYLEGDEQAYFQSSPKWYVSQKLLKQLTE